MQNSGTDTETVKSVDSPKAQIRGMTTYIGTGRESALWKLAPLSLMVYIPNCKTVERQDTKRKELLADSILRHDFIEVI